MAKKSENTGELSFLELDNFLTKEVNESGSIVTDNAFSTIDEYISSGNYLLNAQLSGSLFGGYANSRTTALSGESGVGKSFLALNAAREAQKMGYNIIWCDSEAAQDQTTFENFGVDPNTVRYQPVSTPLDFKKFVSNLLKKLKEAKDAGKKTPKIMLVLDSLGNLATTKERDDAQSGSEKKDMTKASEMRSLFRVITMDLAGAKIPFLFTNHSYTCMVGETSILMKDGSTKQLKDVKIGDEVITAKGSSIVEDIFKMHAKKTFKFTLEDGSVLQCTPNHKFAVEDSNGEIVYKAAEDLIEGDTILQK